MVVFWEKSLIVCMALPHANAPGRGGGSVDCSGYCSDYLLRGVGMGERESEADYMLPTTYKSVPTPTKRL